MSRKFSRLLLLHAKARETPIHQKAYQRLQTSAAFLKSYYHKSALKFTWVRSTGQSVLLPHLRACLGMQ